VGRTEKALGHRSNFQGACRAGLGDDLSYKYAGLKPGATQI
jgi:hypothetical protein